MSQIEHLNALGLSEASKNNFSEIKKAFRSKILTSKNSRELSQFNLAFQYLCDRIFKVQQSTLEKSIIEAIYKGDINFLKKSFQKDPNLVNFRKKTTNYPLLYLATRSGYYDVVQLILKHGCSLDFSRDRSTPMHCAAYYGYDNLIPLLSKYGIPTHIKNFDKNLPYEQACNNTVRSSFQIIRNQIFQKLVQKLIDHKKALGTLNLCFSQNGYFSCNHSIYSKMQSYLKSSKEINNQIDVKKILLKGYFDDYEDFVDVFHGTNFEVLDSIAIHGLHGAGQKVNGKVLQVVTNHIGLRLQVRNQENWAKAIFVSPSIYYAGHPVYSKRIKIYNIEYCPVVQVKVKKGSYKAYNHTLTKYQFKTDEPIEVEYRIKCDDQEDEETINSPENNNVKVVALLLVRAEFLAKQENYLKVMNLVLNSEEELNFKRHGKVNYLNQQ